MWGRFHETVTICTIGTGGTTTINPPGFINQGLTLTMNSLDLTIVTRGVKTPVCCQLADQWPFIQGTRHDHGTFHGKKVVILNDSMMSTHDQWNGTLYAPSSMGKGKANTHSYLESNVVTRMMAIVL